jgi:hypothetical protein
MNNDFTAFMIKRNWCGTKEFQHKYISNYYATEFEDKREQSLLLVELGVRDGADLSLFADWLCASRIVGIDTKPMVKYAPTEEDCKQSGKGKYDVEFDELKNFEFMQMNAYTLDTVNKFNDETIDYLIDDATHFVNDQIKCLSLYYPKIKKSGKVILEDVGFISPGGHEKEYRCAEAIEKIRQKSKDLYNFKLLDLRDKTECGYSVLIELQKR